MGMIRSPIEQELIEQMEQMEVVDAHEHLPPEKVRVNTQVDVFTLFSNYPRVDLLASGMPAQSYQMLFDQTIPLDQRWEAFREFLPAIRYGSYARPAFIAASQFYGCNDISDDTFELLSQRIQEANTPGIYRRILRGECKIRCALPVENPEYGRDKDNHDLFAYLRSLTPLVQELSASGIRRLSAEMGLPVNCLDDYLDLMRACLSKWRQQNTVGIKLRARAQTRIDKRELDHFFSEILDGKRTTKKSGLHHPVDPMRDFLTESVMPIAAELGLVVAVHAGMWHDFRILDPKHYLPVFMRHPETQFDLFHMGMPWIRDTAVIAKNCPNVSLNLCWSHIISPAQTRAGLDEYIDLVPVNKIIGFGADYHLPVEKVYGHLVMARENIAAVLAGRVARGLLSFDEAVKLAQMWLFDNPVRIYGLDC